MTPDERLEKAGNLIDQICLEYHVALVGCVDEETGEEFIAYALGEDVLEQQTSD